MNTTESIKACQAKIINDLSDCETAVADLYTTFSQILPEMKDFWATLADQEKIHARLLLTLHKQLDRGFFFQDLGAVETDSLRKLIRDANNEILNDRNCQSSRSHSLGVAIRIEAGILESRFYKVVSSDAPEFQHIMNRLAADTRLHMEKLEREVRRA